MVRLCLAALLSLLFLLPLNVQAQETDAAPIGSIAEIEGVVALAHIGEQDLAQVGQDVFLHDILETGPDSRVLVLFIDDTELSLGENARATIDEYVFDADEPETNKGRFSVMRGAFTFVTGLIDKVTNPDVAIETLYGSIGIRGTTVWGGTLEDEYNVFVDDGAVTFANDRGRVNINAGQGAAIRGRGVIPGRPLQWDEDKVRRARRTTSLKNAAAVRERITRMKERHTEMRTRHRQAIKERNRQRLDSKSLERRQQHEKRMEQRREHRPELKEKREEIREKRSDATPKRRRLND